MIRTRPYYSPLPLVLLIVVGATRAAMAETVVWITLDQSSLGKGAVPAYPSPVAVYPTPESGSSPTNLTPWAVPESQGPVRFLVSRIGDISQACTIPLAYEDRRGRYDDQATPYVGSYFGDYGARRSLGQTTYQPLPSHVTIPAGQATAVLELEIWEDKTAELTEGMQIQLLPGTGYALGEAEAMLGILDNEPPEVVVSTWETLAVEGRTNPAVVYVVQRRGSMDAVFTAQVSWAGSTATATVDYDIQHSIPDWLTFGPRAIVPRYVVPPGYWNASVRHLTVLPKSDEMIENYEIVRLELLPGSGYVVPMHLRGTKFDIHVVDPAAAPTIPRVVLQVIDDMASEPGVAKGRATFTVFRSWPPTPLFPFGSPAVSGDLTVRLSWDKLHYPHSLIGLAIRGTDYTAPGDSVTIPHGTNQILVSVDIIDDTESESNNEEIAVILAPDPGYSISNQNQGRMKILDDDMPMLRCLGASTVTEGASVPNHAADFHIERWGRADVAVSTRTTWSGTAGFTTADWELASSPTSTYVPAGVTEVVISLIPANDDVSEPVEDLTCTIHPGPGHVIATGLASHTCLPETVSYSCIMSHIFL